MTDWDWALRAALRDPKGFRHLRGEQLLDYRLHGNNAILGDPLLGTLEISRVHRKVMHTLGVPASLQASLQRNRRELRRAWRDRHMARVERFVREREAQVDQLELAVRQRDAQITLIEGYVREREAQVGQFELAVRQRDAQITLIEGFVREREAQVGQLQDVVRERETQVTGLQAERDQLITELRRTVDQVNAQTAVSTALRERLDRIEQSLPWRALRALKQIARRVSF